MSASATGVVVIRGGTVVDATGSRTADVVVRAVRSAGAGNGGAGAGNAGAGNGGLAGTVIAVGPGLAADAPPGALVLDAHGCIVAPGLVDLHAHLREPGHEESETVESGSRAAALGGYTAVVAMPNTDPPIDSAGVVRQVLELGATALCQVAVAGAITVGRQGTRLAPMAEMAALGVRLFTDDGAGVQDTRLMRRAMEYATGLGAGVTLAQHCEDAALAAGGHMHEGEWSSRLGVPGIPAEAEELMVMRDIALARLTGARLHLLHLSTAGSVALVAAARAQGVDVTAEVAPHHFTLTHAEVAGYDAVFKVNPPLRTAADVDAVKAGLQNGTIDAIATDHAPHPQEAKEAPFDQAPPGMLGLETALSLALSELSLPIEQVLALLSWQPARIAGLAGDQGGPIVEGAPANLCVIDPAETWVVEPERLASRSRNTPYAGRKMTGRVRHTLYRGEPVVIDGEPRR